MSIDIRVPDLEPGDYEVVAVGPSFTVACLSGPRNKPTFQVLASAESADDSGFDVLALTGTNILLFLALALALLLAGRKLVRTSKRRHSRHSRA